MSIDRNELRAGLARTWPYLLSHHRPSDRYRCYAPELLGRRVHLCARCAGIYPGIALALVTAVYTGGVGQPSIVLLAPLPALLDWTVTTFTDRRGMNGIRSVTGLLLGYGYGIGLYQLVVLGDLWIVLVGVGYASVAGSLIVRSPDRDA